MENKDQGDYRPPSTTNWEHGAYAVSVMGITGHQSWQRAVKTHITTASVSTPDLGDVPAIQQDGSLRQRLCATLKEPRST